MPQPRNTETRKLAPCPWQPARNLRPSAPAPAPCTLGHGCWLLVGGGGKSKKNKSKQKKKIATSSFSFVVARGSREAPSARLHAKAIASQLKPFLLIQTRKRVSYFKKTQGKKQEKKKRALSVRFCGSVSPSSFGIRPPNRLAVVSLSDDSAGCGLSLSVSRLLLLIVRFGDPTPARSALTKRCPYDARPQSDPSARMRCNRC